jgi:hypothetical protein
MPSWNELLTELLSKGDDQEASAWMTSRQTTALQAIAKLRGDRQVVNYYSAFLQKPQAPADRLSITPEDLNGFMSVIFGMDWSKGLTLLIHTPGGSPNAAQSIVAYLRSKFDDIEVIVPAYAMSAGTMISLAADRLVMGRQSQLGPIDPQLVLGGRAVSAQAVVDQFEEARTEVLSNVTAAHVWAPILQALGPALLQEARNALYYGEAMVAQWLADYMFRNQQDAAEKGLAVAKHFNDAARHKSHGRRIDKAEVEAQDVVVEELEADQDLQEEVLTAYHLFTLSAERGLMTKAIMSDTGRAWVKNWVNPQDIQLVQPTPTPPSSPAKPAPPANRAARRQQQRPRKSN